MTLDQHRIQRVQNLLYRGFGSHERLFAIFDHARLDELPLFYGNHQRAIPAEMVERDRKYVAKRNKAIRRIMPMLSQLELATVLLQQWSGFDQVSAYTYQAVPLLHAYADQFGQYTDDPERVPPDEILTVYRGAARFE